MGYFSAFSQTKHMLSKIKDVGITGVKTELLCLCASMAGSEKIALVVNGKSEILHT
jgi:hypothetical protein